MRHEKKIMVKIEKISESGMIDRKKYYGKLFVSCAIWNWAVAVVFFFVSIMIPEALEALGITIPQSMVSFHSSLALVFVFGVAYYIAGKKIEENKGIVIMGVVEKYLIFTVGTVYFFTGDLTFLPYLIFVVDLTYGILFTECIFNYVAVCSSG